MKHLKLLTLCIWTIAHVTIAAQSEKKLVLEHAVEEIVRSTCLEQKIQGVSLAIILADGKVYNYTLGIGRKGKIITDSTLFFAGNSTELYLATLTLLLQEKNVIDLDAPIEQYLNPGKFINKTVTIRQLLSHTSGIYNIFLHPDLEDDLTALSPEKITPLFIVERWLKKPNIYTPGTTLQYYNPTDYLILGIIIEHIMKRPLYQLLREELWKPLEMKNTFWGGYESYQNQIAGGWYYAHHKLIDHSKNPSTDAYLKACWGSSNLLITPTDAAKFVRALVSGQILQPASFALMTMMNPLRGSEDYHTGIGLEKLILDQELAFGTAGGGYYFLGNRMLVFHHPKDNVTIAIASNTLSNNKDGAPDFLFSMHKDILKAARNLSQFKTLGSKSN